MCLVLVKQNQSEGNQKAGKAGTAKGMKDRMRVKQTNKKATI